ncbi:9458_t:CDS:1, partial [Dentiscutata erythropus]
MRLLVFLWVSSFKTQIASIQNENMLLSTSEVGQTSSILIGCEFLKRYGALKLNVNNEIINIKLIMYSDRN